MAANKNKNRDPAQNGQKFVGISKSLTGHLKTAGGFTVWEQLDCGHLDHNAPVQAGSRALGLSGDSCGQRWDVEAPQVYTGSTVPWNV